MSAMRVSSKPAPKEDKESERPPYPEERKCHCTDDDPGAEPEWEWQYGNTWTCLGCGYTMH